MKKIGNLRKIRKEKGSNTKKNFSSLILKELKKKNKIKERPKWKNIWLRKKSRIKSRLTSKFQSKKMSTRKKLLKIGKSNFLTIIRSGKWKETKLPIEIIRLILKKLKLLKLTKCSPKVLKNKAFRLKNLSLLKEPNTCLVSASIVRKLNFSNRVMNLKTN